MPPPRQKPTFLHVHIQEIRDTLVHHVSTHYSDVGLKRMARQRLTMSRPLFLHDLGAWLSTLTYLASVPPA